MPKKQLKKSSLIDDFVIVEGSEPVEADRRSVLSAPAPHRRPVSNEGNQPAEIEEKKKAAKEEKQHKKEEQPKSGSVKDQNGPVPQQKVPEEAEILPEELENVSFENDTDWRGCPIITNEIPRNVAAKVMARRTQLNNNLINTDSSNLINTDSNNLINTDSSNLINTDNIINNAGNQENPEPVPAPQQAQAEDNPEGIAHIDDQMQVNHDNGFEPQRTERSRWSKSAQVNNAVWRGVGNTVGKLSVIPAVVVGSPAIYLYQKSARKKADNGQLARNKRIIPGWGGTNYNPDKTSGADILEDFRRIPTVWSYLTAGQATDKAGNDLPPKVTVYVDQPKSGSSRSMHFTNIGHTMIGIEYTRYSKITGRKERYNIKYGFYPGGGMMTDEASMMMLKGAMVPGRLNDDAGHKYDISKTYPATREKIEKIAKASETYIYKGGYGYYTRNCTTFVRDMFKEGGIIPDAAINSIFTKEKVRFNSLGNAGLVFANSWNIFWDTSWQSKMGDLTQQDDKSYQGWGNKRITKVDFGRYQATKGSAGFGIKSLSPAAAGENLRRMTDAEAEFGSFKHAHESLIESPEDNASHLSNVTLFKVNRAIYYERKALQNAIKEIMPEEQQWRTGQNFGMWLEELDSVEAPLADLLWTMSEASEAMPKELADRMGVDELVSIEDIRQAYQKVSKDIARVSFFYQSVFESDSRLSKPFMNLLSSLQLAKTVLNVYYQKMSSKASVPGEMGMLREQMLTKEFTIKAGGKEVKMTPTHYESYLQIYKTPAEAVKAYARYKELEAERAGDDKRLKKFLSSRKLDEYKRLKRNEDLADEFDKSHRYMLNKDGFTQADIDYAFRLRRMERSSDVEGTMYSGHGSASETYMALIFDKFFGGIQDEANKEVEDGGLPGAGTRMFASPAAKWLNDYLMNKTMSKTKGMEAILRGIMRVFDDPTAEKIKETFHNFLLKSYLRRMFPVDKGKLRLQNLGRSLDFVYGMIREDKRMSFTSGIDILISGVLQEHKNKVQQAACKKKR